MDSFNIGAFKLEKARKSQRSGIRMLVNFFRVVELCIVLILISKLSTQAPFTVKNSGEYVRGLKVVLVSPIFMFVLGNAIVITLFLKSGKFIAQDSVMEMDYVYEECSDESRTRQTQRADSRERIKSRRKARSEKFSNNKVEKVRRAVHRTKPEKCRKRSFREDAMSNEEFQKTVEEFIARQQKFRMEEEEHYGT